MGNENFTAPPNKSIKTIVNKSEITKNEKIVIGVLLFILCLLLIVVGKKIFQSMRGLPIAHGSIVVGGDRYHGILGADLQYFFNLEQSKKTNIKLFGNLPQSAELSPDGQWIVFSRRESAPDGSSALRIYIMRADGTKQTLFPALYGGEDPTWSPDGKQIAFLGYVSKPGIYLANIECLLRGESCTPAPRLLIQAPIGFPFTSPDWSPDGRKIAYTTVAYKTSHISVINVDGQSRPVDFPFPFSGTSDEPQWSPDGTKIVGICHGDISGVCVINSDGSNLVYLKRDTTGKYASQPRWSPDGQMIAFISTLSDESVSGSCINPDGCFNITHPSSVFIVNAYSGGEITHLPLDNHITINWFFWYP